MISRLRDIWSWRANVLPTWTSSFLVKHALYIQWTICGASSRDQSLATVWKSCASVHFLFKLCFKRVSYFRNVYCSKTCERKHLRLFFFNDVILLTIKYSWHWVKMYPFQRKYWNKNIKYLPKGKTNYACWRESRELAFCMSVGEMFQGLAWSKCLLKG